MLVHVGWRPDESLFKIQIRNQANKHHKQLPSKHQTWILQLEFSVAFWFPFLMMLILDFSACLETSVSWECFRTFSWVLPRLFFYLSFIIWFLLISFTWACSSVCIKIKLFNSSSQVFSELKSTLQEHRLYFEEKVVIHIPFWYVWFLQFHCGLMQVR